MKKFFKIALISFCLGLFVFSLFPCFVEASTAGSKFDTSLQKTAGAQGAGYTTNPQLRQSPAIMIGRLTQVVLSLTGILLLLLMIYGGFIWMNSRGNETEATRAKTILQNAIIGLIVVLMAYAITTLFTQVFAPTADLSGVGTQE